MEIRVVRSIAEIESLRDAWEALFLEDEDSGIFCAYAWLHAAYVSYQDVQPLVLLAYSSEHRLVGIFPFGIGEMATKLVKFKSLVHGASDRADYSSFLISTGANARLIIGRVVRRLTELQGEGEWEMYALTNFSEADGRSSLFRVMLARETFGGVVRCDATHRILLDRGFEEAKRVSNIKRRFRKLTEEADVKVTIGASPDPELLERLVRLHSQSYPGAAFNSARGQPFFRALVEDSRVFDSIEVSLVEVGGEIIAAHFGFRWRQRMFYYVPMYDLRYAQYGPGQYLLWRLITHYRDVGFREFDLLRGGEDYKFKWMNSSARNFRILAVGRKANWWKKAIVFLLVVRESLGPFSEPASDLE